MIQLQNTLTGTKDSFTPKHKGRVALYSCGPTVYDFAHIGNFRSFLMSDLLARVLRYSGYQVTKVMNITDVGHLVSDADEGEDKILKKARLEKKDPYAIAGFFAEAFHEDEAVLRIQPADHYPRATDYIDQQISMTQTLIDTGHAYETNGSVYFRTQSYPQYGKLSKNNLEDLIAGHRVETINEKESPLDFALWKSAPDNHLMKWESPWSIGFPGWHIECSAMGNAILTDGIDIHTGGEDNVFPHHECEIAQNECSGHGEIPYWLHAKHLMVEGKKMSKSLGNFFTIRDLVEKGYTGEQIRYTLISAHYRTGMNFTFKGLDQAKSSIERIAECLRICRETSQGASPSQYADTARADYQAALYDDLSTPDALASVFNLIKKTLKDRDTQVLTPADAAAVVVFLETDFEEIFDVLPTQQTLSPEEVERIEALIADRDQARARKDYAQSDQIRDQLLSQGIELLDTTGKTTWKQV